ncbi:hypothetical protein [Mucilaginibacter lappiensis]|uniref:hypothetical protein n=1 Tax=Mucilaginibacter lappiensis TaxID=354630 RepID=UPI003D260D61
MQLPYTIKQTFFKVMSGQIPLIEFEQWVYSTEGLENTLSEEAYFNLISFDYKKNGAKYELFESLKQTIDLREYETFKLKQLLGEARLRDLKLPGILEEFYDLYCCGYQFLSNLGIGFGLEMNCLPSSYMVDHWSALNQVDLKY